MVNPLFPSSEGKGLQGAYEQAAFMDDTDATFDKKPATTVSDPELIINTERKKSHRDFSNKKRELMKNYHKSLKILKQQKKGGEISGKQFRLKKKQLAKETNAKNWQNFKDFL